MKTDTVKWVKEIAKAAYIFFKNNPECMTDNTFKNICRQSREESMIQYGNLIGYKELDKILYKH